MPVTEITSDPETLTMTLVAEVSASVDRLWRAFTTPAQLERFWGPPGYPASFTQFDMRPGGVASYHMTGPDGQRFGGSWEFIEIDEPRSFTVLDRFVGDDGQPLPGMPVMRMVFAFEATDTGARVTNQTFFDSLEALEQNIAMGAIEGSRLAINQLDAVLHELREFAAGRGTELEILSDTHVRITRVINGPLDVVWRAYTEPELVQKWMLGPDGWTMTEQQLSLEPGGYNRQSWAPTDPALGEPFGFEGETVLVEPGRRLVSTERMIGVPEPQTTNDLSFYEEDGQTLLTLLITYPDAETRDMILATGMVDGMEASYARLERVLGA